MPARTGLSPSRFAHGTRLEPVSDPEWYADLPEDMRKVLRRKAAESLPSKANDNPPASNWTVYKGGMSDTTPDAMTALLRGGVEGWRKYLAERDDKTAD